MPSASPLPSFPGLGDETHDPLENDRTVLEWLTDAHFTVDQNWRVIEVDSRAAELPGSRPEALLGHLLWDVFPAAVGSPFEREARAAMESRRPGHLEACSLEHLGPCADVLFYPDPRGLDIYYRSRTEAERALAELNQTLERRVAERTEEVEQLADQLRALAAELTRVEHRERRRLALILHDHVQQLLVAAKMQVEAIGRAASSGPVVSAVSRASSILKDAITASRTLSVELSPPVLHQSGLAAGLAWLAEHFEQKHHFRVHFRDLSQQEPASEEATLLLFESARELLFNCIKHAGVNEAYLTLTRTGPGQLSLMVEDRGRGFELPASARKSNNRLSLGLFSIQQRLVHCGGRMQIESALGAGVRVTLVGPAPSDSRTSAESKSA